MLELAKYLETFIPFKDEFLPEKKQIHQKIWGKKKFNDKNVRYLLTDLTRLVERYLSVRSLESDEIYSNHKLSEELIRRNHEKAFNQVYRSSKESLLKQSSRSSEYYLLQFQNEHNQYIFDATKKKRTTKSNLENVLSNLDQFFLAKKLQLSCEIFNVQNVLSVTYNAFLLEEILSYLKEHPYRQTPAIAIYYQIIMTLREGQNEEHFHELQRLLKLHEKKFSREDLFDMYKYAQNYCIKQINLGNPAYQKTLLDTYKIILKNGVLVHTGTITQWSYKNVATVSLRQGEYDWAKNFITKYKDFLLPEERENAYSYNLANYYFHKGEMDEALKTLQKVSFTDPYYQLDTRSMMLKIYFEMNEYDVFFYHATAFLTYLRRNTKISEYQKTIYTNLVKYTSKIMRAGHDKKRISVVKKQIEEVKQIADLNWLRKKVEMKLA